MISFMITTGFLNSQDMIRILNSQDMIFQVNIYVMDIVWILWDVYVWSSKFNSGPYGFCKVSLRICYVRLFECKGSWNAKNW